MDDFEKAVLVTFNFTGGVDPSLKVGSRIRLCQQLSECTCTETLLAKARSPYSSTMPLIETQLHTPDGMQAQAEAYLNDLKKSGPWRLCLERFSPSSYQEVKFWCLQTLHEVRAQSFWLLWSQALHVGRADNEMLAVLPTRAVLWGACTQIVRTSYPALGAQEKLTVSKHTSRHSHACHWSGLHSHMLAPVWHA